MHESLQQTEGFRIPSKDIKQRKTFKKRFKICKSTTHADILEQQNRMTKIHLKVPQNGLKYAFIRN